MALTSAQLTTLKAAIVADGTLNALANNPDGNSVIAAAFNAASSPALAVWRADVKASEVAAVITMSEFVALTAVKQNGLTFLMQPQIIDATSATVRAAFSAIFSAGSSLTALTAVAQRTATRLEALFATGGPPAIAPTNVYGYQIGFDEVGAARRS